MLSFASPSKPSSSTTDDHGQTPVKENTPPVAAGGTDLSNRDNSFRQFRRLCEDLEKEPSYNAKTNLVAMYLKYGNSGGKLMPVYLSFILGCVCSFFIAAVL